MFTKIFHILEFPGIFSFPGKNQDFPEFRKFPSKWKYWLQGKLDITRSLGPGNFVCYIRYMYLVISVVKNNRKQSKLFHWDQTKQFVILYQIFCYIRFRYIEFPLHVVRIYKKMIEAEKKKQKEGWGSLRDGAFSNRRRDCQLSHLKKNVLTSSHLPDPGFKFNNDNNVHACTTTRYKFKKSWWSIQ